MGYAVKGHGTHGAGTGRVIINKANRPWGDEWEVDPVLDLAVSMAGYNTGGSASGKIATDLMKGIASFTFKRLLGETVTLLMLSGSGKINIFSTNHNTFWPDTITASQFIFVSQNFRAEFKALLTHFKKVGLNKWGPLADLCIALSEFSVQVGNGQNWDVRISYDWS